MDLCAFPTLFRYMLNGKGKLPAFPMRVACEFMKEESMTDAALVRGLAEAVSVWYDHDLSLSLSFSYDRIPQIAKY